MHHQHQLLGGSRKAFAVGMMHGVAGSAALSASVMTTMSSTILGIVYIIIFGVGSIGGMIAMSVLISVPFIWAARHVQPWHPRFKTVTGVLTIVFGVVFLSKLLS